MKYFLKSCNRKTGSLKRVLYVFIANLGGTKGSFYFFTIPNFDNKSSGKSMAFRFSNIKDSYGHNRGVQEIVMDMLTF